MAEKPWENNEGREKYEQEKKRRKGKTKMKIMIVSGRLMNVSMCVAWQASKSYGREVTYGDMTKIMKAIKEEKGEKAEGSMYFQLSFWPGRQASAWKADFMCLFILILKAEMRRKEEMWEEGDERGKKMEKEGRKKKKKREGMRSMLAGRREASLLLPMSLKAAYI